MKALRHLSSNRSAWAVRAIISGVFLILPSCQFPCLRQPDAGRVMPENFSVGESKDAEKNSAQLNPDQFYNDEKLLQLISDALAGNLELKNLEQEVQIASNEVLTRRGAYLPIVTARAEAGFEKPGYYTPQGQVERQLQYAPGKEFPDPLPNYVLGLNLAWPLDIWREFRNARDAAIQRYYAAIEKRSSFATKLIAEVAENYYELLALDARSAILDQTISLQEQSLKAAEANKAAAKGTELGVQRFQAEVRKNQSEKLIVRQEIVEAENRLNLLLGRYPQPVALSSPDFVNLNLTALNVGLPSQLLQNRPDVRQAERELVAAGLDVQVARAHFYPRVDIVAGVGYQAFNPKFLLYMPESLIYNVVGGLVAPLINKKAIQAEYLTANAQQLEAVYNYQRVLLTAFTDVVNNVSKADNYRKSVDIKKDQLKALETSVDVANKLFQNARAEYIEVLTAQRDWNEARTVMVETKKQQLLANVRAYQSLGGGALVLPPPEITMPSHARK